MKNTVRALGITAALAVMIPLSAYAATTTGSTTGETKEATEWSAKGGAFEGRGGFGHGGAIVSQEVLDLLKLDKAALNEKLKAGTTLSKIAEEQGVSRENLKSAMTEAYNKKLEEQKQQYADNLDKMIDSDLKAGKFEGGRGGDRIDGDLTAVAKVLGLSADEVKAQLKAGKSLADLAADKGVDAQKLIDAQAATITASINEALQAGKLTQEQADKQLVNVADRAEKIVNGKGFGEGRHHGGKDLGTKGDKSSAGTQATDSANSTDAKASS
ncbi:hypothetical protein [Cohnella mopanensis]|uniref:hypothetical protein n=1 Tax=Cohnella mopanensis TaxID=2911966 RepID=UPI001EF77333|nr:hypothetical protein [Cohnella mopanensis]